ncbi:MAG TPA: Bro-N domain-containing protein [Nanoarchaeota archaeon]|nr:Bro-N domain-containing protein [Candidatus Woesearchaeota archaeon]HIH14647.1 Bro-N domain-containing protein [Nanoarchaeota archaeon]HIH59165.1 Bro-N domain-containing protein [Nanoarchaeota archaeon]HII14157.1 Bro-N domain-containing protein [Nanoarchaeota archaeon]HIJ05608.1 Bro-N domain-containing protein [Nanoarchaeota archaeon]
MQEENKQALVVFQDKKIRRVWHNGEWYFSVVDVVGALTESGDARKYWNKLSQRLREEGSEVVTNCHQLKLPASDGKNYETDCANTKNMFRIIQSIPSKHAEPFKLWLAQVGYERVQEIENPELAQNRVKEYYEMKGYPQSWIEKRLRGIAIRQELTDEWKGREIHEEKDFAILTNEISKATFGKTVQEYKDFKGLEKKNQNVRDHMTDWELIFTMLGEKATTDITVAKDAKGLAECKETAQKGGKIAQDARLALEKETGKTIITKNNFLGLQETKKLEHKKKRF